jgi:gas vesicle protein
MKKQKNNSSNAIKLSVIGAGIAGIAATAYFFFGPKGKTHQKHLKAWAIKMKGDIVEKLEMAREVSEPVYHEIIDSVAKEYEKGMKAGKEEINELAEDLKKHWKTITKSAGKVKSDVKEGAERVAKKAGL